MTKLTVVIPCRHQARFIRGLLSELRSELGDLAEIVVVDDASKDDDPRREIPEGEAHLIRTVSRVGPSAARNLGAKSASSPYLYFIDADDRIVPGALKSALALLTASASERALCGALGGFINDEGRSILPANSEIMLEMPKVSHLTYEFFQSGGRIFPNLARFIFDRKLFNDLLGFDPLLERAEDWDFILRWVKVSPILFAPLRLLNYRIHSSNGTVRLREGMLEAHPKSIAAGKLVRMAHGLNLLAERP